LRKLRRRKRRVKDRSRSRSNEKEKSKFRLKITSQKLSGKNTPIFSVMSYPSSGKNSIKKLELKQNDKE
jgi:hypothetical protein